MNLKGARGEKFGAFASLLYRLCAEPSIAPLHRRIGAEVPIEEGRLLDIGCGPGRLDRLLAAARPELQVVGLDTSAGMIRQAGRGPALPNLEFRQGDIASAGFSEEFDFILSVLSFHHWEEPLDGLESAYRALKPGGRFWIYEPDPDSSDEELRADHAPFFGWLRLPMRLQRLSLRGHGFTEGEVESVVRPAVAKTSFRSLRALRKGSTFRFELGRDEAR